MQKITTLLAAALIAMPVSLLAGCSSAPADAPASDSTSVSAESRSNTSTLTLPDGWAKAGETGGMTGVFGTLTNNGDDDLVIKSVESKDAGMIELHEVTAEGVMQKIKGDVVVPANGTFELAPGANHIMLMDLTRDLLAGDEVTFTLNIVSADGKESATEFTVLVKDYAGANENYDDLAHGDMDAGESEHDSH